MVGGDRIAQGRQDPRAAKRLDGTRLDGQVDQERRLLDVGAAGIPGEQFAGRDRQGVPGGVGLEDILVPRAEHLGADGVGHHPAHFLPRRPDVLQVNRLAVAARAQRLGGQIDIDGARQGVGHDQRRTGQIVGLHVLIDAALEVAIAAQDGRGDEVALGDRLGHRLGQRAAVANTRGAAVADQREAELVQGRVEAGLLIVVGHHAAARGQAGLHVRLDGKPALDGLLRDQAGGEHDVRVARVRATGDGGDDHGPVADGGAAAVVGHGCRAGQVLLAQSETPLFDRGLQRLPEGPLDVGQRHAVLRPLRPGQRRLDRAQVELEHLGVDRIAARLAAVEQLLFLRVALDQGDLGVAAAGETQVGERLLVDGEEAHRGPVLRRHVGDQGPIGHFHALDGGPEIFDELVDHAFLAEDLRDGEHQVGGRGARREVRR